MSLFKESRVPASNSPIPVTPIDLSKRYDIYCSGLGEDRLYEDVRITGIRTFEQINEFSSGLIGGYLEIEAPNGTRIMIPHHGIQMLCEHGLQPAYRLLKDWRQPPSPPHGEAGADGDKDRPG